MTAPLSVPEKRLLLALARESLEAAVRGTPSPPVNTAGLTPALLEVGTCFVTLTQYGELRGCIGGLKAEQPLFESVRERAAQAALRDYRFPPVTPGEAAEIEIEISVLTPPQPLPYNSPEELPRLLHPPVDGVILSQGVRRATFLPQVWERVPDPSRFLSMLCDKLGVPTDTWRRTRLDVETYQVEKFVESELGPMD